jgi:hypothetical protein
MRKLHCLLCFSLLLSGVCFAVETFHADLGEIQVFSSENGSHPTYLSKLFGSKISAMDEQHPEVAKAFLDEVGAAGYQIANPQEKSTLYTIEELYAGKPEDYVLPNESQTTGIKFPFFRLLGSGVMCATLHVCNDPAIAANVALDNLNSAQAEVIHNAIPQLQQAQKKPVSMVVSKLCTMIGRSCSLSIALAYDPKIDIDRLRLANAKEGFTRSILLK